MSKLSLLIPLTFQKNKSLGSETRKQIINSCQKNSNKATAEETKSSKEEGYAFTNAEI